MHDGLGEPKGSTAWISPSLGAPPSGSPAPLGPYLGRTRVIKRKLRLVQRTSVGLLRLFISYCDLSQPEPCSDQTVLYAFSLLWFQILICGTLWSPALECVSHPVTGLCPWTELAGGYETGVWCDLKPTAGNIWGRLKSGLTDFSVTCFSKH